MDEVKPPTNLIAFCQMFPSDKECFDYLFKIRWPKDFCCPRCSTNGGYAIVSRKTVQCSNPVCRRQTSVTAGTVLHRSKQSLHIWFWGAYLLTNLTPSISAKQFQRQLGFKRYETAFCMLHKLRSALVAPGRDKLHGEIEVDEGYIGGKEEGCIGRGAMKKQIVVGAVEVLRWVDPETDEKRVRCGRVRLQVIKNVTGCTLKKFIKANAEKGATIITDGWRGYSSLNKTGYNHKVQLKANEEDALQKFHRVFSNLKTWLKGTFHGGTQAKHLQAYLNEFTFRFNRRYLPGNGFNRALGLAMEMDGPTYEDLYNVGRRGYWMHPVKSADHKAKTS